jgi:UDP-4-amino-4,6-dideoxy-N-acetyl-beta-L-altrosamine transaminase
MIPYGRQEVREEDIAAVVSVLRSDWLTQGPMVPRFEKAVAEKVGAGHAVAVNSATSALHVACLALGLGPGDWLWTSPITFVASANCARYCGARVDFVDIDPVTRNIDPNALEDKLKEVARQGRLPKVLVSVHFAGQSCDMAAIHGLAQRYGFRILEDASHAIGAAYHQDPVGSCRYSDITVFSFHPVKIITTGEGGLATSNDPALARHMARLRSHGITREPDELEGESPGPWYYEQIELGYNYRMSDIQAALGFSQLSRLEDYVTRRNALARRYDVLLAGLPLDTPKVLPGMRSAWHLYTVTLHDAKQRRAVFERMRAAGIGVQVHYLPVHLQPDYRRFGFKAGDFPRAEDYAARTLTLPLYPSLTEAEQEHVVACMKKALAGEPHDHG